MLLEGQRCKSQHRFFIKVRRKAEFASSITMGTKQNLHSLFVGQLFPKHGSEEVEILGECRQSDQANKPRALSSLGFSAEVEQL